MAGEAMQRSAHWQQVYLSRDARQVSWYRPHLETSLRLLRECGLDRQSRLIDVGGGASTLVDDLLGLGVSRVTVLDVAAHALELARARLGARGQEVEWLAADVTAVTLGSGAYDLWHDRAVLHFLLEAADVCAYARVAAGALPRGAHAIIGGFAPEGPERCSGLPVARRSAEAIAAGLGEAFELVSQAREVHRTPGGTDQPFVYAVLRRR